MQNKNDKSVQNKRKRLIEIDFLKGLAVISMVIFHIPYLMRMMNIKKTKIHTGILHFMGRFAQTIFITMVGVNMGITYQKAKYKNNISNYHKQQNKRVLKLIIVAMMFTYLSYLSFPDKYVKFGILHFVATVIFLQNYLVPYPIIQVGMLGTTLWANNNKEKLIPFFKNNVHPFISFALGIYNEKYNAMDHFSILKWFSYVCSGVLITHLLYKDGKRKDQFEKLNIDKILNNKNKIVNCISSIGKNSLLIYTVHFPLIYFSLKFLYKK